MNFILRPTHSIAPEITKTHEIHKGIHTLEELVSEDFSIKSSEGYSEDDDGSQHRGFVIPDEKSRGYTAAYSDVTEDEGWITIPFKELDGDCNLCDCRHLGIRIRSYSLVTSTCPREKIAAMTTAACGRIALSSQTHALNPISGEKLLSPYKRNFINTAVLMAISAAGGGPGKGGGLLEKPAVEKATPGRESEFDLRKKRKTSPPYRVLLHNDNFNKREYVVQVLMKVIPEMTLDIAVNVMQEAHLNGMAVVIICAQADAEEHCLQLRGNGLLSSIEPGGASC